MNVKDELLSILLSFQDSVSGSELAERIGCSRMAISKAADKLIEEGYSIEVTRSSGYRLMRKDVLSSAVLSHDFHIPVYFREECVSTMLEAKELLSRGVATPFAVVAAKQEGGRGRLGRSFFSPEGGVYMSLVISGSSVSAPDMITTAASLGTARAIEALTGIECSIKWVNDIYIRGRKAVGILTEGIVNMEEGGLDKAIIGIGVNLKGLIALKIHSHIEAVHHKGVVDGGCEIEGAVGDGAGAPVFKMALQGQQLVAVFHIQGSARVLAGAVGVFRYDVNGVKRHKEQIIVNGFWDTDDFYIQRNFSKVGREFLDSIH